MNGRAASLAALPVAAALAWMAPAAAQTSGSTTCAPGGEPVRFDGTVAAADARTYRELGFDVAPGTTRVEVAYDWQENGPAEAQLATVLDLGLWDADGSGTPDGFRGWSGSRAGRLGTDQPAVYVQQDTAARGYRPAPIEPGRWVVDLGIAFVSPVGAAYQVVVTCSAPDVGAPFVPDPVDPTHVADPDAGWYHGDFHMHGYHSNANAPTWQEIVDTARSRGLDFLPLTDYVTTQHWDELGPIQRANPDVVIWPGREIITYFGHMNAIGETRSVAEYRQGFDGVSMRAIQDATLADGALFQVNHPDFFPPPLQSFCRGCFFELGSVIDWSRVDTIEVVTGPVLASTSDIGAPGTPTAIQNPWVAPAIDRWESLLLAGYDITAVSGSDSKGVESEPERRGYGSSATAVYAASLSRPALIDAVRAGHAYVQARGVARSPSLDFTAVAVAAGGGGGAGATAMVGDTLVADSATMTATITGGAGQLLTIVRDGEPLGTPVPITSDPFTYTWTASRVAGSGPLGTFWRLDVADAQSLTLISNPIFLTGSGPVPPAVAPPVGGAAPPSGVLARTGFDTGALLAVALVLILLGRRIERTFG